jgi:hypothetical protein
VLTTLNRTCSIVVAGTAFAVTLTYPSPFNEVMLAGALCTAAIGKLAKFAFRVKRPELSLRRDHVFSYAFPSSHATSLFYFVAFLSLGVSTHGSLLRGFLCLGATTCYTLAVLYARVNIDRDHTYAQCFGGASLGLSCGLLAYRFLLPLHLCNADGLGNNVKS